MLMRLSVCLILFLLAACGDDDAVATDEPSAEVGENQAVNAPAPKRFDSGEAMYVHFCADCHDAGEGHPGTMRLSSRMENAVLLQRDDLDPEFVKIIVRNGLQMMPPFRPTEIRDEDIDALARFVTQNSTGTVDE